MNTDDPRVPMEQQVYAAWLDWGTRIGLALLAAAFFAYVFSFLPPLVPVAELPRLWALPVDRFLAASGAPTGWGWLALGGKGDYVNLFGVAMLSLITVACYVRVIPLLRRRGDRLQAWLAIAQVAVLLAAASGLLAGTH